MEYIPFNSRSTLHKYPFGCVKRQEKITFKVVLPRNLSCSKVTLVIHKDGEENKYHDFFWLSMQGQSEEWWCLDYVPNETGLYFYHFEYETPWGKSNIMHNGKCLGSLNTGSQQWQLTVYDENFETPNWIKGGIIYQIFPDRFCASKKAKKGDFKDRILRTDWGAQPYWKPTKEGKVLNNDFFSGDFKGIEEKIEYLSSLGVSCIYLNPIFSSHSNHRYDTADYSKTDPLLGTQQDFSSLCKKAKEYGISIILDGVFSHTGDDSVYFNKYARYENLGAFQSKDSPFYKWYKFTSWPDKYHSWWGIDILPEVEEECDDFIEFIAGENSIARKWLRAGARGWRLDVADELPDKFLDEFRKCVKSENSEALILGEVWEDASNKYSYSSRRRYLQGKQLDSVMNYPFADAIISFVRSGVVEGFSDKIMTVLENYPKCVVDVLMNHIGTHDTMRAITCLVGESCENRDRQWQSEKTLTQEQYQKGVKLLKLASAIQYTLPGVPSLYYGDEAGMQGYKDPFNRGCYPWGNENHELIKWYQNLASVRKGCKCFVDGEFSTVSEALGCLAYVRKKDDEEVMIIINRNEHEIDYYLPFEFHNAKTLIGSQVQNEKIKLAALEAAIIKRGE